MERQYNIVVRFTDSSAVVRAEAEAVRSKVIMHCSVVLLIVFQNNREVIQRRCISDVNLMYSKLV